MKERYRFDEEKHRHYIDGKMVPGVTTISGQLDAGGKSSYLPKWAARLAAEYMFEHEGSDLKALIPDAINAHILIRDAAGDLGKRVHRHCERFWSVTKGLLTILPDEAPACKAFFNWVRDYKIRMILAEMHVYSICWGYGGILDLIAMISNKKYLIDLKTSSRTSTNFICQVGGYAVAYEEMKEEELKYAGILRLDKEKGFYEWVDISEQLKRAKAEFLSCKQIYDNQKIYRKIIKNAVKGGKHEAASNNTGDYPGDQGDPGPRRNAETRSDIDRTGGSLPDSF